MMPQYDTSSSIIESTINTSKSFSLGEVWLIISILLAVIGGILLFTTYFGKDKEDKYTGYKKILYDFVNFKVTIIEPIFRVLYLVVAIAITLGSFSLITTNFFEFIGVLVFGNIAARLGFELLLLTLKLFKDVSEINSKLVKKNNNFNDKPVLLNRNKKKEENKDTNKENVEKI